MRTPLVGHSCHAVPAATIDRTRAAANGQRRRRASARTLAGHHWSCRTGRPAAPRAAAMSPGPANATELHRDLPRVGVAMLRLLGQVPLDETLQRVRNGGLIAPIGGGLSRMIALSVSTDVSLANGRWPVSS